MKKSQLLISLSFLLFFVTTSCSTINKIDRKNKDISIDGTNTQKINGTYSDSGDVTE